MESLCEQHGLFVFLNLARTWGQNSFSAGLGFRFSPDTLFLELCRDFQKANGEAGKVPRSFLVGFVLGLVEGVGLSEKRVMLPGCPPKSETPARRKKNFEVRDI
ncbi:MAG TPA: hypothetical protein PL182_02275 [Pseudobdellovibrionaceae bacterium]|nr:hypothetical protein [Pseudobdellovibrionaceae bacterium]